MSLVHVRIVTADRVIHHFDSLEAADQFRRLPLSVREPSPAGEAPPVPHGRRRYAVLSLIAQQDGISSPEMADILEGSVDAINTVLRQLVADRLVVISGEADNKRRLYSITTAGREALPRSITNQE